MIWSARRRRRRATWNRTQTWTWRGRAGYERELGVNFRRRAIYRKEHKANPGVVHLHLHDTMNVFTETCACVCVCVCPCTKRHLSARHYLNELVLLFITNNHNSNRSWPKLSWSCSSIEYFARLLYLKRMMSRKLKNTRTRGGFFKYKKFK